MKLKLTMKQEAQLKRRIETKKKNRAKTKRAKKHIAINKR